MTDHDRAVSPDDLVKRFKKYEWVIIRILSLVVLWDWRSCWK